MMASIFQGELVRLAMDNPEPFARAFSRWGRDSEYIRLLDGGAGGMFSAKTIQGWIEKDLEKETTENFFFAIHALESDQLLGFVSLFGINWNHGDTWVGIGLGERAFWGKGYGTDAMRVILRYAFTELNLHRVTLGVFEYNPRAIRSYEKAGFTYEGRIRQQLFKDGAHWDVIQMGVLREEWLAQMKGDAR
jgi:RimJ/RimL family protein N-acetyltransferase